MDIQKINFSSQLRLSKEIQKSLKSVEEAAKFRAKSIVAQQVKEIKETSDNILQNAALKMGRAIQNASKINNLNVHEAIQKHDALFQELIEHQHTIAKKFSVNHSEVIASFAQNMTQIQPALSVLQDLQKIDLQNFDEVSVDNSEFVGVDEAFFQKLYLYFENKIASSPKGRISILGILALYSAVISTVALLYTISGSQIDQKNLSETTEIKESTQKTNELLTNIKDLGEDLYPLIKDLEQPEKQELIFISKKESPIRVNPTSEADTLQRIPPYREIEVIKSLKRWYYIRYYDFKDSVPKMGYIYKGNVTKVK